MLNLRALIVDDSAIVRTQLRNEIREIAPDCHVFESASVLEAGRFLLRSVPDVLFLDLNMPNINGIELLKRFDAVLEGRRPPIVVSISTDMRPATLEALKARGAYALLPKPFDEAYSILKSMAGTKIDPDLVRVFEKVVDECAGGHWAVASAA